MSAGPEMMFFNIADRIARMTAVIETVDKASKSISNFEMFLREDFFQSLLATEASREQRLDNLAYHFLKETLKKKRSEAEIELSKLRKLMSSLMTACLSRTVIDFKSMFRAKVPLLFKNLDDAHITNQIVNILKFDLSYIPNTHPKWNKLRYRKRSALLTQY